MLTPFGVTQRRRRVVSVADIIRCSIFGTLPGGEVWSVNPAYDITVGGEVSQLELQGAVTAINELTVPAELRILMTSSTAVTGVRLEARTYAGVLEAQAEGLRSGPITGQSNAGMPFQTSLVLSLRTGDPGGSGRGRMYWPATGAVVSAATLRLASTVVGDAITGAKTYLKGIEAAIHANVDESVGLAVWSRTKGSAALVNKIQAGDILDTQRRRRDSVPESYQSSTYDIG